MTRTVTNPIIGDTITFIKTCAETNGGTTICEMNLPPYAQGTPPHYHNSYTETFTIIEGALTVTIGRKTITLRKGETVTVPPGTIHSFTNKTPDPIKATFQIVPGHVGFENNIYIMAGLAKDGHGAKDGLPKDITYRSLSAVMSDTRLPGIMFFIMPLIRMMARRAQKNGIEKELIEKYCPK